MKEGTESYFYHNDHLGTPQKMTAVNGAVVWGAQYEAFGKASVDGSSTVTNNLRFPGQYFDDETGLHYNWFRYYEPESGRYLRVDPIRRKNEYNNGYPYTDDNPVGFFDNLGLETYSGHRQDGKFGWKYKYDQNMCAVTIKIKLVGAPVPPAILQNWEKGIEDKLSNKYDCCEPGLVCGNKICTITVDVVWVTSDEHQQVLVLPKSGKDSKRHEATMNQWKIDTPPCLAAHEVGHMIGLIDEYPSEVSPKRNPVNTGTFMDHPKGPAVAIHFKEICRNIGGYVCKNGEFTK
jgi:RHS repeat-associated protein